MLKSVVILSLFISILLPHTAFCADQSISSSFIYEKMITQEKMKRIIQYLSDDNARGRATGTRGSQIIGHYIWHSFEEYGLKPFFGDYYLQRFPCGKDSLAAMNIAGYVPSVWPSDEYIIVSAHYDHVGAVNGFIYNGADNNASGVAVMMNLAEVYAIMNRAGIGPRKNIVFIAFDAKEKRMAGSHHFVENLKIDPKKIVADINIDQIGTVLEPLKDKNPNFVIVLGENTLRPKDRGKIKRANRHTDLSIDYTYYGSKNFTDIFYKISDQISFQEKGIPALYFTSGLHRHTYKVTDDECLIDYPVLRNRALLIFNLIMML